MSTKSSVSAATSAKAGARRKAAAVREDPRHTWNQQLMEACLACKPELIKELLEHGADPVNAREVPPSSFYLGVLGHELQQLRQQQQQQAKENTSGGESASAPGPGAVRAPEEAPLTTDAAAAFAGGGSGDNHTGSEAAAAAVMAGTEADRLSPLAAMLLSGLNTPAARDVIRLLLDKGASVNDSLRFTMASTPSESSADSGGGGNAPGGGGGAGEEAGAAASARSRSASVDMKKNKKKTIASSIMPSRSGSVSHIDSNNAASGGEDGGTGGDASALRHPPCVEKGTLLHFVVSRGDHAQLLRLLLLAAAPPTPSAAASGGAANTHATGGATSRLLPYSLLPAIEQETVVGALRYHQKPAAGAATAAAGQPDTERASGGDTVAPSPSQQQKGKSRQQGTAATPPPAAANATTASAADSAKSKDAASSLGSAITSAFSAASVEAVFAALQQQQTVRRPASCAGAQFRRLPVLMSAYPQPSERSALSADGTSMGVGSGGGASKQLKAAAPDTWWSLSKLCGLTSSSTGRQGKGDDRSTNEDAATLLRRRVQLDLTALDSQGRTAAAMALDRGDVLSIRLLAFFGAAVPFNRLVNATQTRLARACATGDVARVESLLQQGDRLTQLSADGRYTLIHYAAAHPAVLRVLAEQGLSLEHENVLGESAVMSLLRHGIARNDVKYVQSLQLVAASAASTAASAAAAALPGAEGGPAAGAAAATAAAPPTTAVLNATCFTQLLPVVQRNYILCPPLQLPSLTNAAGGPGNAGGGGAGGGSSGRGVSQLRTVSAGGGGRRNSPAGRPGTGAASPQPGNTAGAAAAGGAHSNAADAGLPPESPFFGWREAGAWWSFLPPSATTADVLDTLLRAGAVLHGYIPDEDLDLPYVRFAESQARAAAAKANAAGGSDEEDGDEFEDEGDDYAGDGEEELDVSHPSLSASANTVAPTNRGSKRHGTRSQPQPSPGRLPLRLTPLQQAIVDYHPELIRRLLLDYRVDPMQRDSQGATALHYAALCPHAPSVLDVLLCSRVLTMHSKAPPYHSTGSAASAIGGGLAGLGSGGGAGGASASGSEPPVAALASSRIDINSVDMAGRTPLFYAALVGNEEAVRQLLRFGAAVHAGQGDKDGCTPLHIAVRQQHAGVVEAMLRHSNALLSSVTGADGGGGGSDLFADAFRSSGAMGGGGSGSRGTRSTGSRRGSHRTSSLVGAHRLRRTASGGGGNGSAAVTSPAVVGATASAELLFGPGATVLVEADAEDKAQHMTPLEMLIKQIPSRSIATAAQLRIAYLLLAEGQASSLRPSGLPNGGMLLHRTVADAQVELTELLLSYYADPNEGDDKDETPLFLAVRTPSSTALPTTAEAPEQQHLRRDTRIQLVRVLLQYGATAFSQSGVTLETPLHLVARSLAEPTDDVEELVQLLYYTAPDHKATAAVTTGYGGTGSGRWRSSRANSRLRENRALSRVLDTMDAESSSYLSRQNSRKLAAALNDGKGGPQSPPQQRRKPGRSGSTGLLGRRHSSMEQRARDKRSPLPLQKTNSRAAPSFLSERAAATGGGGSSARRRLWNADDAASSTGTDVFEGIASTVKSVIDDQLSSPNSSFASGAGGPPGDDDMLDPSGQLESTETSILRRGDDAAAGEESPKRAGEAERSRQLRMQWQVADHLLSPSHCWLLTNAQGQTPLHVFCGSACVAVQRRSAVVKVLLDLQTVTRLRESFISGGAAASHTENDVLSLLWSLPDATGRTPLHAAAQGGFVEAAEIILQQSPSSVTAVDVQGRTPLHAAVLMTTSHDTRAAEVSEDAFIDRGHGHQLQQVVSLLRSTFSELSSEGEQAVALQGLPLRRAGHNVLPTMSVAAATDAHRLSAAATAGGSADTLSRSGGAAQQAVIDLVRSSTITSQLQRWQKARHWGCPTLAPQVVAAAAFEESSVRGWRAFTQLPDGQGRSALLLAAEVGNRSAARELLRQI